MIRQAMQSMGKRVKEWGGAITLMEVCGTHTVSIFRHGIKSMLPEGIELVSGPGCPVCVTPAGDIDAAIELAGRSGVLLCTFGDMMRVPGSSSSLDEARAQGARVEVLYSPLDVLKRAVAEPQTKIVFFATGFETTAPLVAATLCEAQRMGVRNVYFYSAHKLVPPALRALLDSPDLHVDGFILPGHVSTIIGEVPYEFIPRLYGRPGVVTGFEGDEMVAGIGLLVQLIVEKRAVIENAYRKAVKREGNPAALAVMNRCFEAKDTRWRGLGCIAQSGLVLREDFGRYDALRMLDIEVREVPEPTKGCSCGQVLRGSMRPDECSLFGKGCTPMKPVGACMVSSEGSCAAWYRYGMADKGEETQWNG